MSLLYKYRVLDSSPISYNRFGDESGLVATDEIGSADGTYSAASILGAQALVSDETDTAANLNGSTHIKFGSKIRDLLNGKQTVTVEFLIKPNSIAGAEMIMSLPRYANDVAPNICSDPSTRDETSCLLPGSCSNTNYANKNACETAVETWTAAVCSNPSYLDQSTCEAAGICSDPIHTDEPACDGAGETWTPETWTPGSCSDPAFSDQSTCENAVHTWTHDNDWYPWPDWLGHHAFFQVYSNDGKIAVSASTSLYDGWFAESAGAVLTPGVTSHVIAEVNYSTGRIEVYVNNSLAASANGSPESNSVTFNNGDIDAGYEDMVASTPRVTDSGYNISATIDEMSFYDRALSSTERTEHFNEATANIPPADSTFQLPYNSVASNQTWVSLITVELQTEMEFPQHKFNLLHDIETFQGEDKKYSLKYLDDNSLTNYHFYLLYRDPKDKNPSEYIFRFPSRYETLMEVDNRFLLSYLEHNMHDGATSYRYNFLYRNSTVILIYNKFNLSFRHDKSLDVNLKYTFPYFIRTVNAGATSLENSEIIPQGDGTYDYKITLPNVRVSLGDHIAAIDSGSTYSSFFAKFNITYPETLPESVIVFDNYGVTITIDWEGLDVQNLEFYLKDVDIDSSISISAFREDNNEYIAMLNLWPNWSSFINTVSYDEAGGISPVVKDYSYLVELDSKQFKILPLQPESCCILRTKELCMLPEHQELNESLPDTPEEEEVVVGLPVNEMLLMIEQPRSSYIYEDSYRAVITSTHPNATWDDITGTGEGQALEPGVNPFIDINPTISGITETAFKNNQTFEFSNYPITPLSELAAMATFEEGVDNWNEGSLTVDFEFNPAIRPRSSEIEEYEDHIPVSSTWVGEETPLSETPGASVYIMRSLKLPGNKMMVLMAYSNTNIIFYIIDEDAVLLKEETVIGGDGIQRENVVGTVLGNGNIMIVYHTAYVVSFKIYDGDGILVVDAIEVGIDKYQYGITTTHDGNAAILTYTYDGGTNDRTITMHTYNQDGLAINTLDLTNDYALVSSTPAMIENGDNKIVIIYEGSGSYGYQITYNTLTNSWVTAVPYRFTTYNFSNPRGVMIDNGEIVVAHYRANYGDPYYGKFTNSGTLLGLYRLSSSGHPNPDVIATTDGRYKGGFTVVYNYSSNVYIRQYDENFSQIKYDYATDHSSYSQHVTIASINSSGDIMFAYNNYYDKDFNYFRKLQQSYINIVDRDMRRSSDAVIDRKQGYKLSMVNGFIFSTQLVRIERDISYIEGDPTLTEEISQMEHLFIGKTESLPNFTIIGAGTSSDPINISASVFSTGTVAPSSLDSDMIEYVEYITPPVVPSGGFALADKDHYGQLYRSQETGEADYDFDLLDSLYQNPNITSSSEKINCITKVRNANILIAATIGAGYEYSGIYVSIDGGTNWKHSGLPLANSWNSISKPGFAAFNSNQNTYIYNDGDSQESYITTDLQSNPKHWTQLPRHTNDSNVSRGFTYNDASNTWYKASYKAVYASQDSGQSWIEVVKDSVGIPGYRFDKFSGIEIDSQNNVWIAGTMQDDATTYYSVVMIKLIPSDPLTPIVTWSYEYTNSGESYEDYGLIIDVSDNIHFYNRNASTSKYVVLKSIDSGVTFIENDLVFLYDESTYPFGMDTGIPHLYTYINNLFYITESGSSYNRVFKSIDGISWDFVINSVNSDDDLKIGCIHPVII